jgi:lipid-A-disaccharide synthase
MGWICRRSGETALPINAMNGPMQTKPPVRIFVSAGEISGDAILGSVLERLRARIPGLELHGLGGPAAEACGLEPLLPLERTAVSGAWDVLRRVTFVLRMLRRAASALESFRPDLVLLVDYPGLNLRLALRARELGFPVFFIAPPQTWAYRRPERRMRRASRALAGCSVHVLFPFEARAFAATARRVTVGHFFDTGADDKGTGSGTDRIPVDAGGTRNTGNTDDTVSPKPGLCLCPGSRAPVLARNLPAWLVCMEGAGLLESHEVWVLAPIHLGPQARRIISGFRGGKYGDAIRVRADKDAAFREARCAISFPGTVTLELALNRVPTLILAVLDPLTLAIGKRILGSSRLGLPNLLLGEALFPEWAGTASKLTTEIFRERMAPVSAWNRPWEPVLRALQDVIGVVEKGGGAGIAAQACLDLLETARNKDENRVNTQVTP